MKLQEHVEEDTYTKNLLFIPRLLKYKVQPRV